MDPPIVPKYTSSSSSSSSVFNDTNGGGRPLYTSELNLRYDDGVVERLHVI